MKKIVLLILSVMAFIGMSVAQDVYIAGTAYNGVGTENAVVYKDGTQIFSRGDDPSFYHDSYDVLCLDGDVYWVDYSWNTHTGEEYGKVYKNCECFLNNGNGSFVGTLFTDGSDVYAAGYQVIGGVEIPAIWKNDDPTPFLLCDTNGEKGDIEDAVIVENTVYACGYRFNGTAYEGVIWVNGIAEYVLDNWFFAECIAVYNGNIYTLVDERTDVYKCKIYMNGQEFYSLSEDGSAFGMSLDASDELYVLGVDQQTVKVWKNGDVLYSHPEITDYTVDIVANSSGVYYLTDHVLYKDDGIVLATGENFYAFTVSEDCTEHGRTLPYYEGFETGETDWTCWAQWDGDHQNDGEPSYWHRCSYNSASGSYSAWHRYNSSNDQNGLLVTPLLAIPAGGNTTMTFKTYEQFPSDYYYEGVWVVEGGHKASAEVWTQTEPSDEWKTVTIDLSAYQGMDVEIDFRYNGLDAHSWYIDDIMIVSDYQPCPPVPAPYVEHFDTGLGECMYVLDADHDGTCWLWNAMYQAAIHPRGVNISQEGGLLTPRIALPADRLYQLKFDFRTILPKSESWKTVEYSVWMVVDGNGLNNPEDFNEIWRKNFITETNEFETVTIDLAPYSGHTVQFAFSYEGFEAFMWLLDNIEVVEKTGMDENGSNGLAVYPNPASDRIRIEGLEADSEVQIYNALGELVKTVKAEANGEINIEELAKGLYLVRCGTATMRFVKE